MPSWLAGKIINVEINNGAKEHTQLFDVKQGIGYTTSYSNRY